MKIELKNIKYSKFASQETYCFEATLYIEDEKMGFVSNNGNGGCCNYSPELYNKFPDGLDDAVFSLIDTWLLKKDLKRMLKKVTMIDEKKTFTFKFSPDKLTDKLRDTIEKKYPNGIILNDLNFENAFLLYEKQTNDAYEAYQRETFQPIV